MKIVIATDSFKGTLSSHQVCQIIADVIAEYRPNASIVKKPMADGGEGTARTMIENANGRWIPKKVTGPLPDMQVDAGFAWFDNDKTALVEMASASGLELLEPRQMNPLKTTTYGTGQLIKAALDYGAKKILLAVGGSATVDGGIGAAMALGFEFLDHHQNPVPLGGQALNQIEKLIVPENLTLCPVEVLCDVDNPLCGDHGAARIYAPQKGADPPMVEQLEKGLTNLAGIVRKTLGLDIKNIPGAGAAGGLAAGAIAFMNAAAVSGIETIITRSSLPAELESADWVITGEGSFDQQSLRGKVVYGILKAAEKSPAKIAVIAGQVNVPPQTYQPLGITTAIPCRQPDMSLEEAIKNAPTLLADAAKKFATEYLA